LRRYLTWSFHVTWLPPDSYNHVYAGRDRVERQVYLSLWRLIFCLDY